MRRYNHAKPTGNLVGSCYPDLLEVFGTDLAGLESSNDYIAEEQGKLPDFVLEIAPVRTGHVDVGW